MRGSGDGLDWRGGLGRVVAAALWLGLCSGAAAQQGFNTDQGIDASRMPDLGTFDPNRGVTATEGLTPEQRRALSTAQDEPIDWRAALPDETEVDVGARIRAAAETPVEGALARVASWYVRPTALNEVIDVAATDNLSIRIAEVDNAIALARIEQADAVFDPALSLSWSYTRTKGASRGAEITRPRQNEPDPSELENLEQVIVGCIFLDGELINPVNGGGVPGVGCSDPITSPSTITTTQFELASSEVNPGTFSWTATVGLDKTFSYGPSVGLSLGSTFRHRNGYVVSTFLRSPFGPRSDPFGFGSDSPWTSQASMFLDTPLPFTKSFGRTGSSGWLSLLVAEAQARSTGFSEKAVRNAVLGAAIEAYWQLVGTYEQLRFITLHQSYLALRLERIERLLEEQVVTRYELDQITADIANLQDQEELLLNALITQSNTILNLLGTDEQTVILPADYERLLTAPPRIDADAAFESALTNSPQIKAQLETVAVQDDVVAFRENQTLPDLRLSASLASSQSDVTFGYETWTESASNIIEPDRLDLTVGVRLSVPLFYRSETAALTQARVERRQAENRLADVRQQVTQTVEGAVRSYQSALAQIRQAGEALRLSRSSYQRAADLELIQFSEFDVLTRYNDLLTARQAYVSALVQARVAQARVLAAQGVLDERLADVLSREAF